MALCIPGIVQLRIYALVRVNKMQRINFFEDTMWFFLFVCLFVPLALSPLWEKLCKVLTFLYTHSGEYHINVGTK